MTVYAFAEDDHQNPLARIGADELGRIPFGAVELDREGRVAAYNDTEPDDFGGARDIVGRHFFDEVARWASGTMLAEEFRKGVACGEMNSTFDCAVPRLAHKIRIHLKISPILGTYWIFIKKLKRG